MPELIKLMETGNLYFTKATSAQLRIARMDASGILPSALYREALPLPNLCRRDMGSKKLRYDDEGNVRAPRRVCEGPKRAKMIEDMEDTVEADTHPSGSGGPRPQMRNQFGHLECDGNGCWHEVGHHYCNLASASDEDSEDPISEFTDDE